MQAYEVYLLQHFWLTFVINCDTINASTSVSNNYYIGNHLLL
nr:MAG TPA: hypothetical protein [Bacteriophage sp.]